MKIKYVAALLGTSVIFAAILGDVYAEGKSDSYYYGNPDENVDCKYEYFRSKDSCED